MIDFYFFNYSYINDEESYLDEEEEMPLLTEILTDAEHLADMSLNISFLYPSIIKQQPFKLGEK